MKIAIASDLHNEFYGDNPPVLPTVEAQLLVLAGDIQTDSSHNEEWWSELASRYKRIVYIRGNHEPYGGYLTEFPEHKFPSNVLAVGRHPTSFTLYNKTFVCGTMWSDLSNPVDSATAKRSMNDYRRIKYSSSKPYLNPEDTTKEFETFKWYYKAKNPDIVISHHLPSFGSVPKRFRNDYLNAAFASEMDMAGINLWIHGHTHDPCDYEKQGCRVVCNPKGYPGERLGEYSLKVVEA